MNCLEIEEQDIAEKYLLDQLKGPERDEFETHYFACESCFSELQVRRALQDELQLQPAPGAGASPAWFRLPVWVPAFAALFVLIGLGIWWRTHATSEPTLTSASQRPSPPVAASLPSPSPAAPQLALLARVMPPPYVAIALRGPEDHAREEFRGAMQFYVKGDYENAIGGLRAAAIESPRTPAFRFYLGASCLLTHRVDEAVDALRKTVSLGDTAYLESAHFLLGKAYLAEGNVPAAKNEFQATIRLRGSKEAEASEILEQLQR